MLKLLERNIAHIEHRLVLVAPPAAAVPASFENVHTAPDEHMRLVREVQRVRGSVYLEDGAIDAQQLSMDGLHQTPEDERSWHLVFLNDNADVTACIWFLQHDANASFADLRLRRCPLAGDSAWSDRLWHAVESELAWASHARLWCVEAGGWAVTAESRCTSDGLLLALASYSLGQKMGGVLGITMATMRHSSSAILRRVGGAHFRSGEEEIPPYYDPNYHCMMGLLRFDSRQPSARYLPLVNALTHKLTDVPVITNGMWHPAYAVSPGARLPRHAA